MKSKNEIPNKFDYMKLHSHNFLQNEIGNRDILHNKSDVERDTEICKNGQGSADKPSMSKEQNNIATEHYAMDQESSSRVQKCVERAETSITTDSRTDYTGSAPKRYTTKCHIKVTPVPTWYTESVFLTIGSTKRRYEEKVYIKNKLQPYKWSESMYTEVKTMPKNIYTDIHIPVEGSSIHYMSLEPQQIAAGAN